jgi:ArsR family transcriptional regulator
MKKLKVLFLCTSNSVRSQMAEALLRHKAADKFSVFSAGTQPESVDPRALDALNKLGVSTCNLIAKGLSSFEGELFDYVITLCNKASNECRSYPHAKKQFAWDFPDPKSRGGNNPFLLTLNELNNRISMFLSVENNNVTEIKNNLIDITGFYRSLTDVIRLKTLMLTHYNGELCVCELMEALEEQSQPKVSRNLAVLKKNNIITDRKHGQWVFYRINPDLPLWAKEVIAQTTENNIALFSNELARLNTMQNRPDRVTFCK